MDKSGLGGLWREALLAKKVLEGNTKGYKNHPQLNRFKEFSNSLVAINEYLYYVWYEATYKRFYKYDGNKIKDPVYDRVPIINVTTGQVEFEYEHLKAKLKKRNPKWTPEMHDVMFRLSKSTIYDAIHPIFKLVDGPIEPWEKIS